MKHQTEDNAYSFESWLFSKHQIAEKTVGLVVLAVEAFNLVAEVFHMEGYKNKAVITHFLNFCFLIIIWLFLRNDFKKKFSLDVNNPKLPEILSLPDKIDEKGKISELIFHSNVFLAQLGSFNYFLISTAILYAFLIFKTQLGEMKELQENIFHYIFNLLSYIAAFFLLRCFYVMYLPTIDKNGNDKLNRRTWWHLGVIFVLMCIDYFWVTSSEAHPEIGRFFSELICGIVTSIAFILLAARFQNKILDIPPVILSILYVYAILQICLPFVTGNDVLKLDSQIADKFKFIVLTLCLVGKVTLAAVFVYVLSTNRIFYYFMKFRLIHEKEKENWETFAPLVKESLLEPEKFKITYEINRRSEDSKVFLYTARVHGLIDGIVGRGKSTEEAKQNLVGKMTGKISLLSEGKSNSKKANAKKALKFLKNNRLSAESLPNEEEIEAQIQENRDSWD